MRIDTFGRLGDVAVADVARGPLLRMSCFLLAAAIVFLLFYGGAQPAAAGLIPAPWDKLAHVAVYSSLTVLGWIAVARSTPLAVLAAVAAIGALDELHQAGVPGRFADAGDFVVDVCAAAGTATILFYALRHKRRAP